MFWCHKQLAYGCHYRENIELWELLPNFLFIKIIYTCFPVLSKKKHQFQQSFAGASKTSLYFKIRKLHFTYIARTSLTVTIGCEVQLSTDVRSNENKWRGSSSYEVRPPPRPSTNNSDAMNDLSVELSNKLNVKQNILILYCDKLWIQYTFYSYILYSSLDQKLLLFTLSIQ